MSTNAPAPQGTELNEIPASTPRWVAITIGILVLATGWLLYAGITSKKETQEAIAKANQANDLLAKQLEHANEKIADLSGQFKVTSEKLGLTQEELNRARALATNIRKEQEADSKALAAEIGAVKKEDAEGLGKVSSEVAGAKGDIESTRKDLEATKGKLESTRGDLGVQSGLIARNREELEELKRRGERNVFDFNITKTKQPQRVGPIQVRLNKVDVKKYKYTITVVADDKTIEKKDKTVNEPVQFYVRAVRVPYEIVVFEVGKDRITGYLTTPKELAQRAQ
jgi:chromosome segregation ATPase